MQSPELSKPHGNELKRQSLLKVGGRFGLGCESTIKLFSFELLSMYFKGSVLSVKEKRERTLFGPSTGKGKVVKKPPRKP